MKKFFITLITLVFTVSIYAKDLRELIVTTNPPMSCQNCENKIKGNLRFEKGIKKIETNLSGQRVTVEYDADKTNPANIEEAFKKIGYNVEVITSDKEASPKEKAKEAAHTCSGNCGKKNS